MNYFEKVFEWLVTAGVKPVQLDNRDLESIKKFQLLKDLIMEEFKELQEAFDNNDQDEFVDALVDLIWMVLNGVVFFGLVKPFREKAQRVMLSNWTKFSQYRDAAAESVRLYIIGEHPTKLGDKISAYYEKVGKYFIIKRSSDNKVLKSMYYKEPNDIEL